MAQHKQIYVKSNQYGRLPCCIETFFKSVGLIYFCVIQIHCLWNAFYTNGRVHQWIPLIKGRWWASQFSLLLGLTRRWTTIELPVIWNGTVLIWHQDLFIICINYDAQLFLGSGNIGALICVNKRVKLFISWIWQYVAGKVFSRILEYIPKWVIEHPPDKGCFHCDENAVWLTFVASTHWFYSGFHFASCSWRSTTRKSIFCQVILNRQSKVE